MGPTSPGAVLRSANSNASGAVAASGSRNSVTAFTGGAPEPEPERAWAYTSYTYGDSAHVHAATAPSTGGDFEKSISRPQPSLDNLAAPAV
jgi:hypothetical protein